MSLIQGHNISEWIQNRNSYSYIPGKLLLGEGPSSDFDWDQLNLNSYVPDSKSTSKWGSSVELDHYHQNLLMSEKDADLIVGFLSVIFWGYVSGSDGVVRTARALGKVRSFRDGRANQTPTSKNELLQILKKSRELVAQKDYGKALYQLMSIKYLGMSFASKVVMFMSPNETAIYDSVIAERLSKHESLSYLYIKTLGATDKEKINQCNTYEKWCEFCSQTAEILNTHQAHWTDWDNQPKLFRAVDVERSFFALGR